MLSEAGPRFVRQSLRTTYVSPCVASKLIFVSVPDLQRPANFLSSPACSNASISSVPPSQGIPWSAIRWHSLVGTITLRPMRVDLRIPRLMYLRIVNL
jgi:hypothetical protein